MKKRRDFSLLLKYMVDNINNNILLFAMENGIINLENIQKQMRMKEREELLKKHPYSMWQGEKDSIWYCYFPDEEKGRVLKKRKNKKDLEDLIIEFWKEKMNNPTIDEVFEEWNQRKLALEQISKSTYTRNRQYYKRHFKEMGKRKIKSVSEKEFADFLEDQIAQCKLTSKAFSGLKTIVRGFLKRAKRRGLINYQVESIFNEIDVSEASFKRVKKNSASQVFTENELPKVIWYLSNHREDLRNLGVLLILVTGIRVGEAVGLKYEDFLSSTVFEVKRTETRWSLNKGKYCYEIKDFPKTEAGYRKVVIPNNYQWIIEDIKKLNPYGDYLFFKNGERMNTEKIRRRFYYICEQLGLNEKKSPHDGRRTYGSILLDNCIDKNLVISQMGHTDVVTTEIHYHRDRKTLKTKERIFSSIPEFQNDNLVTKSNQL